jgi:hypothetical protein
MRVTVMSFQPGNQFWKQRSKHGAERIMKDPTAFYEAAVEYFEWIDQNPLMSEKVSFDKRGNENRATIYHPHAMTIWGICCYMGITSVTWYEWKKSRPDLKDVIDWAEQIIRQQKFSAAAAGLMNANIISRELGLADKQIVEAAAPRMVVAPPEGSNPVQPPIAGESEDSDDKGE